jgi:uncharacterized protein
MIRLIEAIVFRARIPILAVIAVFTLWMAYFAAQLRMDAGYYKQLPIGNSYVDALAKNTGTSWIMPFTDGHPNVQTFLQYQDRLFGANRVIFVLRNAKADLGPEKFRAPKDDSETIFNQAFLSELKLVTDEVFFLPGIDRRTVTSLWTPNTRILEITEDGITARDVIPGRVTPESMVGENIEQLRNDVIKGNLVGRLVSNDFTASMVVAELLETDPKTLKRLDYFDLAHKLESEIRGKHEKGDFQVHIIGFAKAIGEIADGATTVIFFFFIALLLTVASVYYYCRDWKLTFLTVGCSATSVIWQFGALTVLGYGLDPLAVLVPFLVFAIGVSHGIQQLNLQTAELSYGASPEEAARSSFRGLLIPGSLSLVTAVVGFAALYIVPIPQIEELAITASLGVAMKIVTNLFMYPLISSMFTYNIAYQATVTGAREQRLGLMAYLGVFGEPRVAMITTVVFFGLFVYAVQESEKRHVGDLHPGAPELKESARYNVDSRIVAQKFSIGLDLLTVIVETPPLACVNYQYMKYLNEFSWFMRNQPGVRDVQSTPFVAKQINAGWNEGNLKWRDLPRNQFALVQATGPIGTSSGLLDVECTLLPVQVFLTDGKAETIRPVVAAVKQWIKERGHPNTLSAGMFNSDKVVPAEFLPDGKVVRQPQDPTSSWTLTRDQLAGLIYSAPPLGDNKPQTFRVEGYEKMGPTGVPDGTPVAKTTVDATPDPSGKAAVDIASKTAGAEWAKANYFLVRDVPDGVLIRLASGNIGVTAAVNETIAAYELPTTALVYIAVIILTFFTYFDWRATLCCCLPLTYATFFGYWFMLQLGIGLKVSTLPVIVLVVGVGIDYAYYIYNRLQYHLAVGLNITDAYKESILETGNGIIYTAITFAIGVSTWSFSPLKFQADMGLLLTFMFFLNMVMALTALPGLAVTLDTLFPRKSRPWADMDGGRWRH